MNESKLINLNNWPKQFSKITGHIDDPSLDGVLAFECNYDRSRRPLNIPGPKEYLTLEINTSLSTSVSYQFGDGKSETICWYPGDILIHPISQSSRWTWDKPHSTVVFFLPYFRLKQVMMESQSSRYQHPVLIPGIFRDDVKLKNLLVMIAQEMGDKDSNGPQYLAALIEATLIHLSKNFVTEGNGHFEGPHLLSSDQLERIREFVSDRLDTSICVAALADIAGVRVSQFPSMFRETVGMTPYQYVMQERIQRSEVLLKTTDLSLCDISYITGFSSQSHFTRTFRKHKAITPMSYRSLVAINQVVSKSGAI